MSLRLAEPSDAEAIVALINAAFRVEKFFIDGDRINIAQVRALFETGMFLVAGEQGALDGCIHIEPRGDRAYLGLLSVSPSRQGSGLGSRLLAAAEQRSAANGARFADLRIVNLRQELPAFYRRRGYRETGVAPFPAEIQTKLPCHFVTMSKPLSV